MVQQKKYNNYQEKVVIVVFLPEFYLHLVQEVIEESNLKDLLFHLMIDNTGSLFFLLTFLFGVQLFRIRNLLIRLIQIHVT